MTEAGLKLLKIHEGLMLRAYHCPAGVLTIGYGHTAGVQEGDVITEAEADRLLRLDVATAEADARSLMPNWDEHSPRRQDALIDMSFNMGYTRFSAFGMFLSLFRQKHYVAAALDLEHTKWYTDVKTRAKIIVQTIMEG